MLYICYVPIDHNDVFTGCGCIGYSIAWQRNILIHDYVARYEPPPSTKKYQPDHQTLLHLKTMYWFCLMELNPNAPLGVMFGSIIG